MCLKTTLQVTFTIALYWMGVIFTGLWSRKLNWSTVIIAWNDCNCIKIKDCRLTKRDSLRDIPICFLGPVWSSQECGGRLSFIFVVIRWIPTAHTAAIFRWDWNTDKDFNHIIIFVMIHSSALTNSRLMTCCNSWKWGKNLPKPNCKN